jgi:hypothetical protein
MSLKFFLNLCFKSCFLRMDIFSSPIVYDWGWEEPEPFPFFDRPP